MNQEIIYTPNGKLKISRTYVNYGDIISASAQNDEVRNVGHGDISGGRYAQKGTIGMLPKKK